MNKMRTAARLMLTGAIATASLTGSHAQNLNLSIGTTNGNHITILGTASAPGFTNGSMNSWGAMGITMRIPKAVTASPAPSNTNTGNPDNTHFTNMASTFTGATPRNAFTGALNVSVFDMPSIGGPNDGYWYWQFTETTPGGMQSIPANSSVTIMSFDLPATWSCVNCVEIVNTQIAGSPISTIPFVDNSGTGNNVLSITNTFAPLPIALVDFTAAKTGDGRVQLNWKTASEEGSDYFEVERSADARTFGTSVAHVKAAGTSFSELNYQSYDVSPLAGDNFYRLKLVGLDGKVTYSQTRRVNFGDAFGDVVVYPTDNKDGKVSVSLPKNLAGAEISLVDAVGRRLPVSVGGAALLRTLSLQGLAAGTYMVQVALEGQSKSFKIVYHP